MVQAVAVEPRREGSALDGPNTRALPSGPPTSKTAWAVGSALSYNPSLALWEAIPGPPSGDASFPKTHDERLVDPGSDCKLSVRASIKLLRLSERPGARGGLMQGESLYSSHVLTSKKSTS